MDLRIARPKAPAGLRADGVARRGAASVQASPGQARGKHRSDLHALRAARQHTDSYQSEFAEGPYYGGAVTETKQYPQTFFQPDPGACQILLVRHGQSAPFVEGTPFPLVDGQGDPPLSPLGEWQADQVGARLATEPIEAIYATSLQRTRQTAAPLAAHLDLPIAVEPDLREVHLGVGEGGLFRKMSAEGHPSTVAMRANREWGEVEGAESNAQFAGRTVPALQRLAAAHADQLIAVFVHGGTIGSLLGHALGVNMFNLMGSRTSAISPLVVNGDAWTVRSFNDGAHAGPLTADAEPPT